MNKNLRKKTVLKEGFLLKQQAVEIADRFKIPLVVLDQNSPQFKKQLRTLYSEHNKPFEARFCNLAAAVIFAENSKFYSRTLWAKLYEGKYVSAGVFFREIGRLIDIFMTEAQIGSGKDELPIDSYHDHLQVLRFRLGKRLAEDYFESSIWGWGMAIALWHDLKYKTQLVDSCIEQCMAEISFDADKGSSVLCRQKLIEVYRESLSCLDESFKQDMTKPMALSFYSSQVEPKVFVSILSKSSVSDEEYVGEMSLFIKEKLAKKMENAKRK